MIISFSRKFVFIHAPKCAGESVEFFCGGQLPFTDLIIGPQVRRPRGWNQLTKAITGLSKHSGTIEVKNWLGDRRYSSYFSFSIVRHPEKRVLSCVSYLMNYIAKCAKFRETVNIGERFSYKIWPGCRAAFLQNHGLRDSDLIEIFETGKSPSSLAFFKKGLWRWSPMRAFLTTDSLLDFINSPYLAKTHGLEPLSELLCDAHGRLMVTAFARLENLDAEWPVIAKKIGVDGALPTRNMSRSHTQLSLDEPCRQAVQERYRRDYEMFGYPPDPRSPLRDPQTSAVWICDRG